MKKSELLARWSDDSLAVGLEVLKTGTLSELPFGRTTDGLADLRGFTSDALIRPEKAQLRGVDFSFSRVDQLIFAKSTIEDCRFDSAMIKWGDFRSTFRSISFVSADLRGSSFGGNISNYEDCDFSRADLSGISGSRANFVDCDFHLTKFNNSMVGNSSFSDCRFSGQIRKSIFHGGSGGGLIRCDIREATFLDCGFNNMRFEDCQTSEDILVFEDWAPAVAGLERAISAIEGKKAQHAVNAWVEVWKERMSFTPANLIDRRDIRAHFGDELGSKVFDLFMKLHAKGSKEAD